MEFEYSGKLYVQVKGEHVFGPGRAELLERIMASGSIRMAAKEMKMSYRQAWQSVDHMNKSFGQLLVVTERGGKGGGKTIITPFGVEVLTEFKSFHLTFKKFIQEHRLKVTN